MSTLTSRTLLTLLGSALCVAFAKTAPAQFQAAPTEWVIGLEGGLDLRGKAYRTEPTVTDPLPAEATRQTFPAPYTAASAALRIPNLRAYYGLRLEGHLADWTAAAPVPGVGAAGESYTAAALLTYRAFLFDMDGDCDCPTWGKDRVLQRAFFVDVGLGYARQAYRSAGEPGVEAVRQGAGYAARMGLELRAGNRLGVFLAAGAHGVLGTRLASGRHSVALRPALGLTYRGRRGGF